MKISLLKQAFSKMSVLVMNNECRANHACWLRLPYITPCRVNHFNVPQGALMSNGVSVVKFYPKYKIFLNDCLTTWKLSSLAFSLYKSTYDFFSLTGYQTRFKKTWRGIFNKVCCSFLCSIIKFFSVSIEFFRFFGLWLNLSSVSRA